jgi:hypothetical protein
LYLIGMLDDATSRGLARFAPQDSTAENMRLLWNWLDQYGRFVDAYTDRASLFETNRPHQRDAERDGKVPETQIGRALGELGIGWIAARSPQAKGRIERFFETAQDRLVKGMRKGKVRTMEAANAYLGEEYMPLWNERFTVQPASAVDAHRPLGKQQDLASILSHVETRTIGQDYTVRYEGQLYQIVREQIRPRLCGQAVRVEKRLDGRLVVRDRDGELTVKPCQSAEAVPVAKPKPRSKPISAPIAKQRPRWMDGFHLHGGPSLEEVVATAYGDAEDGDRD